MKPDVDYTLYLVTDNELMSTDTVEESVEKAIQGGVTLVQLREKTASAKDFYEVALRVRDICRRYSVPLIINDRVDIALAVDAEGVHVGQEDLPAEAVRNIIGPEKILGVSATNLSEALAAVKAGADYLGVGAMKATGTKNDARLTSLPELQKIQENSGVPVVVIGGIGLGNACAFGRMAVDGLAVVSAIVAQPDIAAAAGALKEEFVKGKSNR